MKLLVIALTILLTGTSAYIVYDISQADSSSDYYISSGSINNSLPQTESIDLPKTDQEKRNDLYESESQHPEKYLFVSCRWAGNTPQNNLTGSISNSATLAGFKDIEIEISFLSITGSVLGTKAITVYEYIPAGKVVPFSGKCNPPEKTDKISIHFVGAKKQ